MSIPTPPLDNSGGIMMLKVTNGSKTHRMRVHVLAFNDDATGTYVVPPAGGDASVTATWSALQTPIKALYTAAWTLSLDALFHIVAHAPVETFAVATPNPVVGTSVGAESTIQEGFACYNFRTALGGRMRLFLFGEAGWTARAPYVVASGDATTTGALALALTAATSAVVAHDGAKPVLPSRVTYGMNKKLRRKYGDA